MVFLGGVVFSAALNGHPNRVSAIDAFCQSVRREFAEMEPRYFSGPDPWVQLDSPPEAFSDLAVARVFSEGTRVCWVILQMSDSGSAWFETTNYFFSEKGDIQKRERHYEQVDANMQIEEVTYFANGKPIKDSYHHAPLAAGEERPDKLADPGAPQYFKTTELPLLFAWTEWHHLALR